MPDFNVIADVSLTLRNVLTASMSVFAPPPVVAIHDLQGIIQQAPPTVTLFLFDVAEDPSARNRTRIRDVVPPDVTIRKPPLALMLRYLITPWGGDRVTEQTILGRVMQTLYDGAILSGTQLSGTPPPDGLAGSDQALKITPATLTLDERSRIWYSVLKPNRLSVAYEVRVVNLDSAIADQQRPVGSRQLDYEEDDQKDA